MQLKAPGVLCAPPPTRESHVTQNVQSLQKPKLVETHPRDFSPARGSLHIPLPSLWMVNFHCRDLLFITTSSSNNGSSVID